MSGVTPEAAARAVDDMRAALDDVREVEKTLEIDPAAGSDADAAAETELAELERQLGREEAERAAAANGPPKGARDPRPVDVSDSATGLPHLEPLLGASALIAPAD